MLVCGTGEKEHRKLVRHLGNGFMSPRFCFREGDSAWETAFAEAFACCHPFGPHGFPGLAILSNTIAFMLRLLTGKTFLSLSPRELPTIHLHTVGRSVANESCRLSFDSLHSLVSLGSLAPKSLEQLRGETIWGLAWFSNHSLCSH